MRPSGNYRSGRPNYHFEARYRNSVVCRSFYTGALEMSHFTTYGLLCMLLGLLSISVAYDICYVNLCQC